jgi:hypothetical protein
MPDRDFIENYPLFRKFKYDVPSSLDELKKPAIHMYCNYCKSDQTFNMSNEYFEYYPRVTGYPSYPSGGRVVRAVYLCSSCKSFPRIIFIKIGPDRTYVVKVGQEPPWEISMDRNLEKMLGAHSEYYKKGLTCESQGYGIGAFSYYRRIVEEIIDELLTDIADLIPEEHHKQYMAVLEEVKKTIIAQDKIRLVKDLLPSTLRPNGINPLSILYDILSESLHAHDDETCLELAMHLRKPIVYLANEVILRKSQAKTFTDSMRKFLDKRAKKES